jgi:hypothetical protein
MKEDKNRQNRDLSLYYRPTRVICIGGYIDGLACLLSLPI